MINLKCPVLYDIFLNFLSAPMQYNRGKEKRERTVQRLTFYGSSLIITQTKRT